ncbi:hypothetical protein TIFTF001_017078 [Ficus carica]|uniref:Uncharacterized protein n=1 Tax=Ficus carica TaxID=3494 RepID=A0AA88ABI8_FICCA|nr:hypothetical protein TIFTF001_017078 [Ficus carica]
MARSLPREWPECDGFSRAPCPGLRFRLAVAVRGSPAWDCAVLGHPSDAEVSGCFAIRLELGCRGLGNPGCLARPWLEWSGAQEASTFRGLGCSGRPNRVGYLGHPRVGWPSLAPARAAPVRECGPGGLLPILDTFPEIGCSEHNLARYAVHPGETVRSGRASVLSENDIWSGCQHLIRVDRHLLSCSRGTVGSGTL